MTMSATSSTRCATPRCVNDIEQFGERLHSVHPVSPGCAPAQVAGATDHCSRCGGFFVAGAWRHVCRDCGTEVQPGELRGMFVPSRCPACDDKVVAEQRTTGSVCTGCKQVYAYCCC